MVAEGFREAARHCSEGQAALHARLMGGAEAIEGLCRRHSKPRVAITSYGRISGYFVSAREYEELQRLREFERRVYRIKELPAEIADAIKVSKMDSSHDHLNALLDEK